MIHDPTEVRSTAFIHLGFNTQSQGPSALDAFNQGAVEQRVAAEEAETPELVLDATEAVN